MVVLSLFPLHSLPASCAAPGNPSTLLSVLSRCWDLGCRTTATLQKVGIFVATTTRGSFMLAPISHSPGSPLTQLLIIRRSAGCLHTVHLLPPPATAAPPVSLCCAGGACRLVFPGHSARPSVSRRFLPRRPFPSQPQVSLFAAREGAICLLTLLVFSAGVEGS